MKISKRKKLLFLSLFAIFIISATSFLQSADDSNLSLGIQIYRLDDGTTLVVNRQSNFDFSIPSGWYSLLLPASPNEIEEFNVISQQNNLPLDKNWVSSQTYGEVLLIAADLEPDDYKNDPKIPLLFYAANIADVIPGGLVTSFIDLLKSSGRVTNAYVTKYSEQEVGIVEFQSLEDESPFLGGKLLAFIRDGHLYVIMGATGSKEVLPKIQLTIDDISGSLNFYDVK